MEGRALTETPTWAVATVVGLMVIVGLFFHASLKRLRKVKRGLITSLVSSILIPKPDLVYDFIYGYV